MNPPLSRQPAAGAALTSLIGIGLFADRDSDAIALLEMVRLWQPESVEVRFYDAWLSMRGNDFREASHQLAALVDEGVGNKSALCRALLAACLFVLKDVAWEGHADAVIENDQDPTAIQFCRILRGEINVIEPQLPVENQEKKVNPNANAFSHTSTDVSSNGSTNAGSNHAESKRARVGYLRA